jgi:hypothetical protein
MLAFVSVDAAHAARWILERVRSIAHSRWLQGARKPALECWSMDPDVRLIAERRLYKIGELEARALVGWASGTRKARLYGARASVEDIVRHQAEGARCVSLLEGDVEPALGFALHDLRHLEKLFDPLHYRAQVGFFRWIARSVGTGAWKAFDRELDAEWTAGRDYALADMNGSPIFLWAVLKMKLKMAVRRKLARDRGVEPPSRGVLDADEIQAFGRTLDRYLDVLQLERAMQDCARRISARRDSGDAAARFLAHCCLRVAD